MPESSRADPRDQLVCSAASPVRPRVREFNRTIGDKDPQIGLWFTGGPGRGTGGSRGRRRWYASVPRSQGGLSHCWRWPTAVPCLHPIRVEAPWGFPRMGTADGVASGCSNSSGEDHVAGMRQGSPTINRSDAAATTPLPRHGKDTVVTSRGQNLAAPCLKDHLVPSHGLPVPGRRYGLEPTPPQRVAVAG